MNLNALANGMITAINPNIKGKVLVSIGNETQEDGTVKPVFREVSDAALQIQATTGQDLTHVDAINVQGIFRTLFANRELNSVNRFGGRGGDMIQINTGLTGKVDTWLVTQVLEPWTGSGWTKAFIVLQGPNVIDGIVIK